MPRSKELLRTVLNRSLLTMETRSRISTIIALAKEYQRLSPEVNKSELEKFLRVMQEAQKGPIQNVSLTVQTDNEDNRLECVRSLLESAVICFLNSIQIAMPHIFTSLNSIDWRQLFGIDPPAIVNVNVMPASDEDSGEASVESMELEMGLKKIS